MTAASIALALDSTFRFSAEGLRVGDRVSCNGATLDVHLASSGTTLEADLLGAAVFDGFAPLARTTLDLALLAPVESAARGHRSVRCGGTAFGLAASAACDALLERLSLSVRRDDGPAAERAARALVGLGPGLTPSGDDALCGFMLGRCLNGAQLGVADAAIKRVASSASRLTSDVSALHLALAAQGRFGETLLAVASALIALRAAPLSAAVVRCLAQGATSGADGLLGLVAGARAGHRLATGIAIHP
jgi:hypothetical protein